MKTAIIKQLYDVFGPWSGFLWKDMSPQKILAVWPVKAVYWELTCILEADWYIIPPIVDGDYVRDVIRHPGHAQLLEKYTTNVMRLEQIPLSDYDLVITFDPILKSVPASPTVFAYYVQEHWDHLYTESLQRPLHGYDLFLDHMLDALQNLGHLPQAVSFPYIHDADFLRSQFAPLRREIAWVDHRVPMTLAGRKPGELAAVDAAAAMLRLEKVLGMTLRCRAISHTKPWGVYDPPNWSDTADYFKELAACQYYLACGDMAGPGQGLAEAAALGCLCIGQTDRAYHRLLCHPDCLCEDIAQLPAKVRNLQRNPDLQQSARAWQDERLGDHFLAHPLATLRRAVEMKRNRRANAPARVDAGFAT